MTTATTNWIVDIALEGASPIESDAVLNSRDDALALARKLWKEYKDRVKAVSLINALDGEIETLWIKPIPLNEVPVASYGYKGKRYKVSRPKEGKWAEWTFFATGSEYNDRKTLLMVRPDGRISRPDNLGEEIANAIAANPAARMKEFGDITGTCAKCGRPLEDPESVARGLGPVCAKSF
jgi:hypothetical protein